MDVSSSESVNLFLFTGDRYLRERAARRKIKEIWDALREPDGPLGEVHLDGEEITYPALLERLGRSLFHVGEIVWIRNADRLTQPEQVADLLAGGLPEGVHLILDAERLDRNGKLYRTVANVGKIEVLSFQRRELRSSVKQMLRERRLELSEAGFHYLVEHIEPDLMRIDSELEKLSRYHVPGRRELDLEAVQGLLFTTAGTRVFDFLDALGNRRLRDALDALEASLRSEEEPGRLFFMAAGHIRALLRIRSLVETGYSDAQIARTTDDYPWRVKRRRRQANNFAMKELITLIGRFHQADVRIKRGEIELEDALLGIVLAL
ncbi:MAG: DNA polymerase III subunit delta [Candidatus Bipolaricaulia bacterium]